MQEEYRRLTEEERPAVIAAVSAARAQGDLRENEAYHAARHKQALIQGRIEELKDILKDVQVAEAGGGKRDIVVIGAWVGLEVDAETRQVQVVAESEADIKSSKISSQSPLGKQLMGKRVGDVVEIEVPAGTKKYKVVEIR